MSNGYFTSCLWCWQINLGSDIIYLSVSRFAY